MFLFQKMLSPEGFLLVYQMYPIGFLQLLGCCELGKMVGRPCHCYGLVFLSISDDSFVIVTLQLMILTRNVELCAQITLLSLKSHCLWATKGPKGG